MKDYKLNDIEIEITEKIADEIVSQTEEDTVYTEAGPNEYIVITVNDYDVW